MKLVNISNKIQILILEVKVNKKKIKLSTPEMVADFINVCSKYECDINLYDGRNVLDAQSIMGVFGIM